jgi:hypothetical protein
MAEEPGYWTNASPGVSSQICLRLVTGLLHFHEVEYAKIMQGLPFSLEAIGRQEKWEAEPPICDHEH